jgi:hypothetical protein
MSWEKEVEEIRRRKEIAKGMGGVDNSGSMTADNTRRHQIALPGRACNPSLRVRQFIQRTQTLSFTITGAPLFGPQEWRVGGIGCNEYGWGCSS